MRKKLYIISNRLPVAIDEQQTIRPASGGLATAMNSYLCNNKTEKFEEVVWAGVPGCSESTWHQLKESLVNPDFTYLPVFMAPKKYNGYYNGFSNSVLWPLFHYFPSYAEYNTEHYGQYLEVNQQFAGTLLAGLSPSDTVWIHDYHLLPLARLLRKALPGLQIGFFLHIPFPSYELFRLLPGKWQEDLLKGMLGADLIGFHTADYVAHFQTCLQMTLGLQQQQQELHYDDRSIRVKKFPISIDFKKFHEACNDGVIAARRLALQNGLKEKKVIFSIDRLDYTKGVMNRLKAYYQFLKQNPHYAGRVVFILALAPSRSTITKYAERKKLIDEYVSNINSRLGTVEWMPVLYLYKNQSFEELMSLYTACNLALITPLRDGMNLVAKEFIASRKDKQGVLLLSEMAGASRELTGAVLVNPNDVVQMAQKIKLGLEMPEEEQQQRMEAMQARVSSYDVTIWANDFMSNLAAVKTEQHQARVNFLDVSAKASLLDAYRAAGKRLLLLDYDGTLVAFQKKPELAVPGEKLIALLKNLGEAEENDVYLISGRNKAWLHKYFGDLPVGLVAEHGAVFKMKQKDWERDAAADDQWKKAFRATMESYTEWCANTFVEEKEYSVVWHYRNAIAEQGMLRALELAADLHRQIGTGGLQVMMGDKIVEVRQSAITKGGFARQLVQKGTYDFIFAAGDDRTDEDTFRALSASKNAYTIKVGEKASMAQYNMHNPRMIVSLLQNMHQLSLPVTV